MGEGEGYLGTCDLCGYGPTQVLTQALPGLDDEPAVCSACEHSGLWKMHAGSTSTLAAGVARLFNVVIDAQGPAHRAVAEALLRGDGLPSGEYGEW